MWRIPNLSLVLAGVVVATTALNGAIVSATDPDVSSSAPHKETWNPLFNGKDFEGWYSYLNEQGIDSDPDEVFQVEDGSLHIYSDQAGGALVVAGYLATREEYSYYHLRFEYKWGAKKYAPRMQRPRDAGLIYHFVGADRLWPRGIECQVQERDTGDCYTVNGTQVRTTLDPLRFDRGEASYLSAGNGGQPQTVGGPNIMRIIKGGTYEIPDEWNTVEVIVRGAESVTHIVNGHENFKATDLKQHDAQGRWVPLTHGRILLQAEYSEIFYRNIEIRPIAGGPLHPQTDAPIALRVPAEFEITRVAASPLVEYPTLACLDDQGRMYVSQGAGVNDHFDELQKTLPRSIRRLEDTDGNGTFDRSTLFADKMTFPYGGVWYDGALYVASPPNIWRLADTDGDGVADRRDVVLGAFRSGGLASCMKGCYLAPDGWLYFCGGNEGGYDLQSSDGVRLQEDRSSPGVFRMRPDGTHLELVATGAAGVYDLCFDPTGDIFGVFTIMKYPRGDGLMHWVYGGTYLSSRPTSRNARLTGDKLPPLRDWGQTSPSGTLRYESGIFGEEYRGNLFTAHFNTHNVTRTIPERTGATWQIAREENFITSDNPYSFLTDVLEDADGSLLVVETGSWFHLGCPLSPGSDQPMTGAIYRVRKKDAKVPVDSRGAQIAWETSPPADLVKLLDDSRFVVRDRAIAALAAHGLPSVPALRAALKSSSADVRRNAVWALTRIDHAEARAAVRDALRDQDDYVRQAAVHSAGLWRDKETLVELVSLVGSAAPAVRREAAAALGRCGDVSVAPALFAALPAAEDRIGEHALIYALIELSAGEAALAAIENEDPKIRCGALVVLEALTDNPLEERHLRPLLTSANRAVQEAALKTALKHRGWKQGMAELLANWVAADDLPEAYRDTLLNALTACYSDPAVRDLVVETLENHRERTSARLMMLDVLTRLFAKRGLPEVRQKTLRKCLTDDDETIVEQAIALAVAASSGKLDDAIEAIVRDADRSQSLRITAALAALGRDATSRDTLFDFLVERCRDKASKPVTRLLIARGLATARLSESQQLRLTDLVAVSGPLELPILMGAFDTPASDEIGPALVAALRKSLATDALSAGCLERLFGRYPPSVQEQAATLLAAQSPERAARAARLEELKFALEGGDPIRGHDVFFHRAPCFACHRVGKEGSSVGPELTHIAETRSRRELLEAVAFPSATFARGYEPYSILTSSATVVSGIIRRETRDAVYLLTAERSERAIPQDEIEEVAACRTSIMPQGLERDLSPKDLQDLLAFLTAGRRNKEETLRTNASGK